MDLRNTGPAKTVWDLGPRGTQDGMLFQEETKASRSHTAEERVGCVRNSILSSKAGSGGDSLWGSWVGGGLQNLSSWRWDLLQDVRCHLGDLPVSTAATTRGNPTGFLGKTAAQSPRGDSLDVHRGHSGCCCGEWPLVSLQLKIGIFTGLSSLYIASWCLCHTG